MHCTDKQSTNYQPLCNIIANKNIPENSCKPILLFKFQIFMLVIFLHEGSRIELFKQQLKINWKFSNFRPIKEIL